MDDILLINFLFGILFSEIGALLTPVILVAVAIGASAYVQFEPVSV